MSCTMPPGNSVEGPCLEEPGGGARPRVLDLVRDEPEGVTMSDLRSTPDRSSPPTTTDGFPDEARDVLRERRI